MVTKHIFSDNTTPEIHADYFSILSKEAIINGAGVVKLFFDNITEPAVEIVESEKQLSFWQKIGNSIVGGVKFVISVVDGLINTPPSTIESAVEEAIPESEYLGTMGTFVSEVIDNKAEQEKDFPENPVAEESEKTEEVFEKELPEAEETFLVKRVIDGDSIVLENGQQVRYIGINTPDFPNECFASESANENKRLLEGKMIRMEKDTSETDKYGRLLRYIYLDSMFINDYLVRNGYAYDFAYEPDIKYKERFASAEEEAKQNRRGLWGDVCHPIIVQGPQTRGGGDAGISENLLNEVNNQTQSQEQNQSPEPELPPEPELSPQEPEDTMPPDVSFNSLIFNYASSSVIINWLSLEASVSFDVELKQGNGDWQELLINTQETQTTFIVEEKDIVYYFRVRDRDLANNQSAWKETSINIIFSPVVINEIAWMGTKDSPQDEWIELFNRADYDINLINWSLKANDNSPEIIFSDSKIISANGYFLLERTSDDPTSEPADWYGSFGQGGLNNSGEILELRDGTNGLIDSVDSWYAGDNNERRTMERINPVVSGTEPKNWKTYIGSGSSTTDSKGNSIFGTPKAKNSVYKLYTVITKNITQDTTWTLENSPYLIYDNSGKPNELLEISDGITLTIEPGVIVKFVNPGLKVFGMIKAIGIAGSPIVFTDYDDKEYAGGVFNNATSPLAGAWSGIWITESSADSIFDNIIIRYAGSKTRPFRSGSIYSPVAVGAAIRVENTSVELKNSTVENSLFKGIWLVNSSDTIIENSTFQNHREYDNLSQNQFNWDRNMAVYLDDSVAQIKNSTFQNNITGIYLINNSEPIIENNDFSNNSYPIWVNNSYPQFSDNQIENNNWNGIVLTGIKLAQNYVLGGGSAFINYQEIPSESIVVPSEYTLTIEPGTIIKSVHNTSGLTIEGTLIADGTVGNPIVFTSFYDDEYGGDTNGDGNTSKDNAKAGSWGQIIFTETSTNSSLNYAVIRYGGGKWIGAPNFYTADYVLDIKNSSVAIANSTIENNTSGAYLENSNSQIANTTFRNHQYTTIGDYTSTGLYLNSSAPTIDISTFLNNKLGVYIDINSWLDLAGLIFGSNNQDFKDLRPPAGEPGP